MRAPFQVLVIPYKRVNEKILYGIFLRNDMKVWQFIAGGGEDSESPIEAAKREGFEEANIDTRLNYINLDSITSIPVENITGEFTWGNKVYVVTEYAFGVNVENQEIILSSEHEKMEWLPYNEVLKLLRWDSNKTALWELNKRIKKD